MICKYVSPFLKRRRSANRARRQHVKRNIQSHCSVQSLATQATHLALATEEAQHKPAEQKLLILTELH
eukprot:6466493-Amphidinium_carterae.2